jgi:hypothetical protein
MTANRLKHIQPRIAPTVTARVLTLDIERIPGHASVKHRALTIEGDFWDLNGWKHTIGRRIHPDDVTEWPRTICAAAKWYDQDEVMFAAEWQVGGYDAFLREVWTWVNDADLIIGHHAAAFDLPILVGDWAIIGLPAPSPYKVIDTLKIARKAFSLPSNTLDSLAKRLGVDAKTDKYEVSVAKAAVAGDRAAQARIESYNRGDIIASEALADRLRPYSKGLPHMGMWAGSELACPNCGHDMTPTGKTVHANVQAYAALKCLHCGTHGRDTTKLKSPTRTRSSS